VVRSSSLLPLPPLLPLRAIFSFEDDDEDEHEDEGALGVDNAAGIR
jgi:hypothetical protein